MWTSSVHVRVLQNYTIITLIAISKEAVSTNYLLSDYYIIMCSVATGEERKQRSNTKTHEDTEEKS